jgi:hypothetical protein
MMMRAVIMFELLVVASKCSIAPLWDEQLAVQCRSHFWSRQPTALWTTTTMTPLSSIEPPKEAVDCVAYLNEAWTPYHAVLASCKRLVQAGFQVRARVPTDLARSHI